MRCAFPAPQRSESFWRGLVTFRFDRRIQPPSTRLAPTRGNAEVRLPLWLPALCLAILPLLWLRVLRQTRKRLRLGLCPTCGYDLRATPSRCPECGHIPHPTFNRAASHDSPTPSANT